MNTKKAQKSKKAFSKIILKMMAQYALKIK